MPWIALGDRQSTPSPPALPSVRMAAKEQRRRSSRPRFGNVTMTKNELRALEMHALIGRVVDLERMRDELAAHVRRATTADAAARLRGSGSAWRQSPTISPPPRPSTVRGCGFDRDTPAGRRARLATAAPPTVVPIALPFAESGNSDGT